MDKIKQETDVNTLQGQQVKKVPLEYIRVYYYF